MFPFTEVSVRPRTHASSLCEGGSTHLCVRDLGAVLTLTMPTTVRASSKASQTMLSHSPRSQPAHSHGTAELITSVQSKEKAEGQGWRKCSSPEIVNEGGEVFVPHLFLDAQNRRVGAVLKIFCFCSPRGRQGSWRRGRWQHPWTFPRLH